MAPAKSKNQKMSLGDFLNDETLGSWADEMEDMPVPDGRTGYGGERRAFSSAGGFGTGFGDRGGFGPRDPLPFPDKPPYTAHIGNLSFDATEGDITDFFTGCSVTNVRIVEDKLERKPKGFGYVEFATLDGLKKALDFSQTQFQGRSIRVSVAEPPKDRPDARELNDWTRKGPLPDLPGQRRVSDRAGFGSRGGYEPSDAGSDRGERRRPAFEQGDGKVRDFGNWERKGPLTPSTPSTPTMGEPGRPRTNDGPRERRQSPAWGEGRSQDGSRPPRREFQERPPVDRAPTAAELDNQWRSKMRKDAPVKSPAASSHDGSNPPSPAAAPAALAHRPRLNLQKRTVSEAEPAAPSPATSDSKASPFGAARPIDTFAREREIEEKRELAHRQKKEHDDKVREEKRLAKEAAKAEKAAAAAQAKENGEETAQAGSNLEAPQKEAGENGSEADEGAKGETEEGTIVDDKAVKPQEIVRDPPAKSEGAWRKKSEERAPEPSTETSADSLEEDGWSTVSKTKNNRRGGARAIAS
ncbi:MAG: hypothetical protein M1819_005078 [Sarea resinae]|nr:MAG: hypothetical protein M1819_005078 [Sarea resinae]